MKPRGFPEKGSERTTPAKPTSRNLREPRSRSPSSRTFHLFLPRPLPSLSPKDFRIQTGTGSSWKRGGGAESQKKAR
ncbi:unnamed protein product [Pipistrellus nathusii]|uniref:Uncharacterized protein n=1 Tax=Pipistrellus nathusii TaxID=59473 RepID=A0ABN9ZVH0_PIPNA